jgi:hypothetical protein
VNDHEIYDSVVETIRRSAEIQSVALCDNEYDEMSNAAARKRKNSARWHRRLYYELAVIDIQQQIQDCLLTSCPSPLLLLRDYHLVGNVVFSACCNTVRGAVMT